MQEHRLLISQSNRARKRLPFVACFLNCLRVVHPATNTAFRVVVRVAVAALEVAKCTRIFR